MKRCKDIPKDGKRKKREKRSICLENKSWKDAKISQKMAKVKKKKGEKEHLFGKQIMEHRVRVNLHTQQHKCCHFINSA